MRIAPLSSYNITESTMKWAEGLSQAKDRYGITKFVGTRAATMIAVPTLSLLGTALNATELAVKTPLAAVKGGISLVTRGKYGTFGAQSLNGKELKGHAVKTLASAVSTVATPVVGLFSTTYAVKLHEKLGLKQRQVSKLAQVKAFFVNTAKTIANGVKTHKKAIATVAVTAAAVFAAIQGDLHNKAVDLAQNVGATIADTFSGYFDPNGQCPANN